MQKNKEIKVPKLRFPEFSGEWEKIYLEKLIKINYGKDYKHLEPGIVPVYGSGGVISYVEKPLCVIDAIGIGRKGTINNPIYLDAPFWTVDTLFYCVQKSMYSIKFLYQLILNINFLKYNEASGVPSLSSSSINSIQTCVPRSNNEAGKIAVSLEFVDKKIKLLEEKLNNLKLYKKGYIQNTLYQLEQSTPKRKLEDLVTKMFSGGTPKSTEQTYYGGDIPFLTISDITNSGKYLKNVSKSITKSGFESSASKIAKKGTVIYTMYATIAIPIITAINVAIPQSVMALELSSQVDTDFIYYQLDNLTDVVRSKFTETGTQGNINSNIVKNLKLTIPSLLIQKEASKNFNLLNCKINKLTETLQNLKQFKKGLLQQMFV